MSGTESWRRRNAVRLGFLNLQLRKIAEAGSHFLRQSLGEMRVRRVVRQVLEVEDRDTVAGGRRRTNGHTTGRR